MVAAASHDLRLSEADFMAYLAESRALVVERIQSLVPTEDPFREVLYDLILDYPLRPSKGLRPALCLATCRAVGGSASDAVPAAVALELFHNAFLIHDDIEDGSEQRRGRPALQAMHGTPIALNVGDATIAMAMQALLENMPDLGPVRALRVLHTVSRMARETAEGQALELHWVRHGVTCFDDAEYIRLAEKKTAWYTFVTPMSVGAALGNAAPSLCEEFQRIGLLLGVAFQIQDDVLNLTVEGGAYGKERWGDLWEGKHTLVLAHMLRSTPREESRRAQAILRKKRPSVPPEPHGRLSRLIESLSETPHISPHACGVLREALSIGTGDVKTETDIEFLIEQILARGSIDYARAVALRYADQAADLLREVTNGLPSSEDRRFLLGLVDFAVNRDW